MRAAGTRVHFLFDMPLRTEQGTGVVSADGDDGFLVLDDARFDDGTSCERVWIPLLKLRKLWANELPAAPARSANGLPAGAEVRPSTFLWIGDVVLDRSGSAWAMHTDKLLRSASFSDRYALTLAELIDTRGPILFHGHDDDKAGE